MGFSSLVALDSSLQLPNLKLLQGSPRCFFFFFRMDVVVVSVGMYSDTKKSEELFCLKHICSNMTKLQIHRI